MQKKGENLIYNLDLDIPKGATHFLVTTKNKEGESPKFASTLILDRGLPHSGLTELAFEDVDPDPQTIGGTLKISSYGVQDRSSYALYYGNDQNERLVWIKDIPYDDSEVGFKTSIPIPNGTKLDGATRFVIFAKNRWGEQLQGSSLTICQNSIPTEGAKAFNLERDFDENPGHISCLYNFKAGKGDISGYRVYWGQSATEKLAGQPHLEEFAYHSSDESYSKSITGKIPKGARYILIFAYNSFGEIAVPAFQEIQDAGQPSGNAENVRFTDDNPKAGLITGTIKVQRAPNEEYITDYLLYWGLENPSQLGQWKKGDRFAILSKDKALELELKDVEIPVGAQRILVVTRHGQEESSTWIATQTPLDSPFPVDLDFKDSHGGELKFAGTLKITPSQNMSSFKKYNLYARTDGVWHLIYEGSNSEYEIPKSDPLKTSMWRSEHSLLLKAVIVDKDDKEGSPFQKSFPDYKIPIDRVWNVTFEDDDAKDLTKLAGTLRFDGLRDESNVTDYVVYFGNYAKLEQGTKDNKLPGQHRAIIHKAKVGNDNQPHNYSVRIVVNSIPEDALSLLIFVRNGTGVEHEAEWGTNLRLLVKDPIWQKTVEAEKKSK